MFRLLRAGSDLQTQREKTVSDLNNKIAALGIDASIVFDAQYQEGAGSRTQFQSLEIFFTDKGETADEFIIRKLKAIQHPKQEVVVTSDNILAWKARSLLAKTMSVKEFIAMLDNRIEKRTGKTLEEREKPPLKQGRETEMERWLRIFEERSQKEKGVD